MTSPNPPNGHVGGVTPDDESRYFHGNPPTTYSKMRIAAELASMRNLVAALFRLEHGQGSEVVQAVLATLVEWLGLP